MMQVASVEDLVRRVHETGGLVVAAHVDGARVQSSLQIRGRRGNRDLLYEHESNGPETAALRQAKRCVINIGIDAVEMSRRQKPGTMSSLYMARAWAIATVLRNDAQR